MSQYDHSRLQAIARRSTTQPGWRFVSPVATELTIRLVFTDTSDEPVSSVSRKASDSSSHVIFRFKSYHSEIKRQFPERTDALCTIDKVLEALRQEHGGVLPDLFFKEWDYTRTFKGDLDHLWYTPEKRETLVKNLKKVASLEQIVL